jgi:lipopolysaccharide export system protein LptA
MKQHLLILFIGVFPITSCTTDSAKQVTAENQVDGLGLKGTWKLVSGTKVAKGLTTFTDYSKDLQMVKIINDTHFAFLKHNLKSNADGKNNFDAGGGRYELSGNEYIEHLDYYNDSNWEGKAFNFKVTIKNDTLIQTGLEKIESEGIDQTITEKYVKVK